MKSSEKKGLKNAIKSMRVVLAITILLVMFVLIYFHFSNVEPKEPVVDKKSDVVGELLSINLENNYPTTVREVVLEFTKIQKCYYNENINEDELKALATRARILFDEELLNENPFEEYYDELKKEIREYKANEKTITRVYIDKSSDVVVVPMPNGDKASSIQATYYCKDKNGTTRVAERYILRKDADDRWKIYGWGVVEEEE